MTESFLDMPNKMYPGTWVVLGVVLAAILAGFIYLLVKYLKSRTPWKKIPGSTLGAKYYGKDHRPNTALLLMATSACVDLLTQHTKWNPADIIRALRGLKVYVMPTKAWKDYWTNNVEVAGLDPAGDAVVVGVDFAALLHECAHQCEDVIDKTVDYGHEHWPEKGIRNAEDEYAKWLSAHRIASGITQM